MKVIQITPALAYGDAIGNDTLAIRNILLEAGFETGIYAGMIDRRIPEGTAKPVEKMPRFSPEDILIYHGATGSKMNEDFLTWTGRKVMIYHNLTPAAFFEGWAPEVARLQRQAVNGIRAMGSRIQLCIADSEYNKQDLLAMGYTCPIEVCPIVIPFADYDQEPDAGVLRRYGEDGWVNLLFVGRISPNKKQEDVIRAFYCYQREYNPKSRLFLVGSSGGMEKYDEQLKRYAAALGLADRVIFPGHIRFSEILAYYRLADVFLCMSEHEGFCVPLVEAMYLKKPIIAYQSSAVPDTLSGGGLLLKSKDPQIAAAAVRRLTEDGDLREALAARQRERLKELSYEAVKKRFLACLDPVIQGRS